MLHPLFPSAFVNLSIIPFKGTFSLSKIIHHLSSIDSLAIALASILLMTMKKGALKDILFSHKEPYPIPLVVAVLPQINPILVIDD